MGFIKRLQRITAARIEAFLASVEDPETVFPQLVREMEQKVEETRRAEAKALTAVRSAQRKLDELTGRVRRYERGAQLALSKGDEDTARDALAAQVAEEKKLPPREAALAQSESALRDAGEARKRMEEQLADLRARKNDILARARVATSRKNIEQVLGRSAGSGRGLLDMVARMEEQTVEEEAENEIRREMDTGTEDSLEERLGKLERDAEVEKRLSNLRKRRK